MTTLMQIMLIVGSRPEAIKLAPVAIQLARRSHLQPFICSSGQQADLLDPALAEFGLVPNLDLAVMRHDQSLGALTSRLVASLTETVRAHKPDWILVQGDTTTAMAGALVGFYERVLVGHVEAGVRSRNLEAPFPEEVNRRVATLCSSFHFAPTSTARDNLVNEGVPGDAIEVTGNTVVDALQTLSSHRSREEILRWLQAETGFDLKNRLVLMTSHRRESFGEGLGNILEAARHLVHEFDDVHLVMPVHPNPQVQAAVARHLQGEKRVSLIQPQPYSTFLGLMAGAYLIITDSGGLQEEAPSLGIPVVVARNETDRPETIEAGGALLAGTSTAGIVREVRRILQDAATHERMSKALNPYGDGKAAERIVERLDDIKMTGSSRRA